MTSHIIDCISLVWLKDIKCFKDHKNKYKPSGGKIAAQVPSHKERPWDRDAGNKSKCEQDRNGGTGQALVPRRGPEGRSTRKKMVPLDGEKPFDHYSHFTTDKTGGTNLEKLLSGITQSHTADLPLPSKGTKRLIPQTWREIENKNK